jgi:hypothetical protein
MMDFIKGIQEARMTRDAANKLNLTYNDCKERVMLLFLALEVMRYYNTSSQQAAAYAQKTVSGNFQTFRIGNTDLHNFLYYVVGPKEAQDKLKNPAEAKKFRQHTTLPVSMIQRHLQDIAKQRTPLLGEFGALQRIEAAMRINNSEYKTLRRFVANYAKLSPKERASTATRLIFAVRSKLPDSDLTKAFQDLVSKANLENVDLASPEPDLSVDKDVDDRRYYRLLVPSRNLPLVNKFIDYAQEGKAIPSALVASYGPIIDMIENIVQAGPSYVEQLKQLNNRAKRGRK